MAKCKCMKCGKLIALNKFEMCKDCRTVERKCVCGKMFKSTPKKKSCDRCDNTETVRKKRQKKSGNAGPALFEA